ncbi:MAG TPA: thioredoxin domain-containing protein, partial [Nitrospiraceae bacterium]|nr:thioredoxin domain-containing protein [Nitrospiraceae bacterium]
GVVEAYRQHPDEVQKNIERVKAGLRRVSSPQSSGEPLNEALLDGAVQDLGLFYEPVHGGFGEGPKFPTVPPLSLLLRQAYRTNDHSAQEKVLHQLQRMAAGGIYDQLGGGFHRYSVDGQWLVPHFEKMLYDNAQLVRIYLDGWRLTRELRFKQVVEETLEYIGREMMHTDGGFYAAQDADSEGHEGKYFVWEPNEIKTILGTELGELFCRVYGVTNEGNFEGKSILNRLASANLQPEEMQEVERVLAPARRQLLEVRERRVKPERDDKILTSWNGLIISALLDAYQTLGVPAYLAMAEKALTFLLEHAYQKGRLSRTVTDGRGRLNGYLDDYAFLVAALVDAFEATSNQTYFDKASELIEVLVEQFWDQQMGGCFFTGKDHEPLIQRMKSGTDSAIPSGNAVAAMNSLRLFYYAGEQHYFDRAEQTLRLFRSQMDQNAYGSAAMLCTLDFYLAKPKEIVLVGQRTDPRMQNLLSQIHGRYVPNKTLMVVDGTEDAGLENVPAVARGKTAIDGKPTAYVCHNFTCSQPVTDGEALVKLLGGTP